MIFFFPKHSWKFLRALSTPVVLPWASSPETSPHTLCPGAQECQSSSGTSLQSLLELWYCYAGLEFFLLDGPWTCVVALSPASGFNSCISWLLLLDGPRASPITSHSLDCQWILLPIPCSVCHVQRQLLCASSAVHHIILSHRANKLLLLLPIKAT